MKINDYDEACAAIEKAMSNVRESVELLGAAVQAEDVELSWHFKKKYTVLRNELSMLLFDVEE